VIDPAQRKKNRIGIEVGAVVKFDVVAKVKMSRV
jgi:hypothetical protein